MKVAVFAALFVLGNHSCLCTDRIPGVVPFLAALELGWDAAFRSVLLGMPCQEWALCFTPSVPWASSFRGTGESVSLLVFTCGMRERGIYGDFPDMETYGVENADLNFYFPFIPACSRCHK